MFTLDSSSIDKALPVPVGTQLHGLLTYMLGFGGFAHGTRLPSIRQLAADLGIAPMTVAQVYNRLRDDGLIEMRQGQGAFAKVAPEGSGAPPSLAAALHDDIGRLLARAESLGVPVMSLVSMLNAQSMAREARRPLNIVFICIFEAAGRDYVGQIRPWLAGDDRIDLVTFDDISRPGRALERCRDADLVLTFLHREADARRLTGLDGVLGLRMIPSQQTRQALAGLDPRTQVLGVTQLKDYIAIMRPSIREFAPHVAGVSVTWSSAADLSEEIARSQAVIFATGADHVAQLVPRGTACFEFRHSLDPSGLDSLLTPALARRRQEVVRAA